MIWRPAPPGTASLRKMGICGRCSDHALRPPMRAAMPAIDQCPSSSLSCTLASRYVAAVLCTRFRRLADRRMDRIRSRDRGGSLNASSRSRNMRSISQPLVTGCPVSTAIALSRAIGATKQASTPRALALLRHRHDHHLVASLDNVADITSSVATGSAKRFSRCIRQRLEGADRFVGLLPSACFQQSRRSQRQPCRDLCRAREATSRCFSARARRRPLITALSAAERRHRVGLTLGFLAVTDMLPLT